MNENWYLARNKQRMGPFTAQDLRMMVAMGQVHAFDMVLKIGTQKWVPAGSLHWLFPTPCPVRLPAPPSSLPLAVPNSGSTSANQSPVPPGGATETNRFPSLSRRQLVSLTGIGAAVVIMLSTVTLIVFLEILKRTSKSDIGQAKFSPIANSATPSLGKMPGEKPTLPQPTQSPVRESPHYTLSRLKGQVAGTFETSKDSATQISFTFLYPRYQLNPSRDFVWAKGTDGTWDLLDSHIDLTAQQRVDGWYIFIMTLPEDADVQVPAHVKFGFDENSLIDSIRFASFFGIQFPTDKQMVLYRAR